jgi:hypothetical protein
MVERGLCFSCNHWVDRLAKCNSPRSFIIDGAAYWRADERPNEPSSWQGFGGRTFHIRRHSGEVIVTSNLWHNGHIPAHFLARMPNDADFVQAPKATKKAPPLENFLESTFGRSTAIKSHTCTICKGPATEFDGPLSIREYTISGLCQECQDKTFRE